MAFRFSLLILGDLRIKVAYYICRQLSAIDFFPPVVKILY